MMEIEIIHLAPATGDKFLVRTKVIHDAYTHKSLEEAKKRAFTLAEASGEDCVHLRGSINLTKYWLLCGDKWVAEDTIKR